MPSPRLLTTLTVTSIFFRSGCASIARATKYSTIVGAAYGSRNHGCTNPYKITLAGTRYILVNQGGWDHHGDIYGKTGAGRMEDTRMRGGLYSNCGELDPAFAALIEDLKQLKGQDGNALLSRTLVMVMGEFGRTPGKLTDIKGRDHWPAVRCGLFAGAGIRGGRVIGETDAQGGKITKFDWHKNRPIYPEDVTATIYSALGIDWGKKIEATPSGRAFEYVEPMSGTSYIGSTEIKELWS